MEKAPTKIEVEYTQPVKLYLPHRHADPVLGSRFVPAISKTLDMLLRKMK